MQQILNDHKLVLMEAAIVELLRRSGEVELHPRLVNAPLIYEATGREALRRIYQSYIDIALAGPGALPDVYANVADKSCEGGRNKNKILHQQGCGAFSSGNPGVSKAMARKT